MPELPEVETVKSILAPQLTGQTIRSVTVRNPQVIAHPDAAAFAALLCGQTVCGLSRRGKFLTLHFACGDRLVLHLRMTGQLLVTPADAPDEPHTHLTAELSGGQQLRYIDVRRFGRFWYLRAGEPDSVTGQSALGLEPTDPALTADYLKARLGGRRRALKTMLLDQTVVAGIGNIYADEILFAAGIAPATDCAALDDADWCRLAATIPDIILWGIETNRMTPEDYLAGKGKEYRNTPVLRVYGRAGQPCPACRTALEKATVGGRSSCFCPRCQKNAARTPAERRRIGGLTGSAKP